MAETAAVKKSPTAKVAELIAGVKENWNVPKPGEYTSIKEFMMYCLGIMGVCAFTFICNDTVAFTATYLCGSIFEIKMMDFTIITFIALAVKYATLYLESISMTIFENLGHLSRDKAKKAGIAYAVYRFFICDDYDEFDEDFYFDDDDIADLLEEDGVEEAETEE